MKSFSAEEGLQNQMVFTSDNFSESISISQLEMLHAVVSFHYV